jgi:antitoxin ParD1/3/4
VENAIFRDAKEWYYRLLSRNVMAADRVTLSIPPDMAMMIESEIAGGHYASTSDVVHEALADWSIKKQGERARLEILRHDIDQGIADAEAGRFHDFSVADVMERGRLRSGRREPSV